MFGLLPANKRRLVRGIYRHVQNNYIYFSHSLYLNPLSVMYENVMQFHLKSYDNNIIYIFPRVHSYCLYAHRLPNFNNINVAIFPICNKRIVTTIVSENLIVPHSLIKPFNYSSSLVQGDSFQKWKVNAIDVSRIPSRYLSNKVLYLFAKFHIQLL